MENLKNYIKELLNGFNGSELGNDLVIDDPTERTIDVDFAFIFEGKDYQIVGCKNMWRYHFMPETYTTEEDERWTSDAAVEIYLDEETIGEFNLTL